MMRSGMANADPGEDLRWHSLKTEAPDEAVVAFANDDVADVIHRHTAAFADEKLIGRVEKLPVAGLHKNISADAIDEQMHGVRGVHIPKLRAVVQQQQITARRHRPHASR